MVQEELAGSEIVPAVIFDMDGVIVDSEVHWKKIESNFLRGLIPTWSESDQRQIIGMSVYDVHALLVKNYSVTLTREEYLSYYQSLAEDLYGARTCAIPGVLEVFDLLFGKGFPLAIASSSPKKWMDVVIDRFHLRNKALAIVSSDDVGGRGKPWPDIYLFAAQALNRDPSTCVAIEDTKKGVESAKSAGIRGVVGIRNGFNDHQDLSAADLIINGFSDARLGEFLALS